MATLIKTLPVLVGSVTRVPCGVLADRIGARLTFPILMFLSAVSVYGLSLASTPMQLIWGAAAMGIVGSTFVVGVQSVSSWSPKERGENRGGNQ
jgi:NNP family nitrate/nitrite transporter-like MFS transporter